MTSRVTKSSPLPSVRLGIRVIDFAVLCDFKNQSVRRVDMLRAFVAFLITQSILVAGEKDVTWEVDPVADAMVATHDGEGRPVDSTSKNFGRESLITSGRHSSGYYTREAFLRFDLAGTPGDLQSAKLRLTLAKDAYGLSQFVALVPGDTWSEDRITWKSKPNSNEAIASWEAKSGVIEIDVTDAAKSELAGDGKLSLRIFTTSKNGNARYHSREATDVVNRPSLIMTTSLQFQTWRSKNGFTTEAALLKAENDEAEPIYVFLKADGETIRVPASKLDEASVRAAVRMIKKGEDLSRREQFRELQDEARANRIRQKAAERFGFGGVTLSTTLADYLLKYRKASGIERSVGTPNVVILWQSTELKYPEYPSYRLRQSRIDSYFVFFGNALSRIVLAFQKGEGQSGRLNTTKNEPTYADMVNLLNSDFGEPDESDNQSHLTTWHVPEANRSFKIKGEGFDKWYVVATNEDVHKLHLAELKKDLIADGPPSEVPSNLMPIRNEELLLLLFAGEDPAK